MSKRKNKTTLVTQVDDVSSIARDFRRRYFFESYRPIDYKLYSKIQDKVLYPMLDRCLNQLLPGSDDGNQNMMNNKLLAIGQQSMVDLERQRIFHQDTIRRLAARRAADRADLELILEAELQKLELLQTEHRKTLSLLETCEKGDRHNEYAAA